MYNSSCLSIIYRFVWKFSSICCVLTRVPYTPVIANGQTYIVFVSHSTHLYASRNPFLDLQLGSTLMTVLPNMVSISGRFLSNVAMLECEEVFFYPFCLDLRSPNSVIGKHSVRKILLFLSLRYFSFPQ